MKSLSARIVGRTAVTVAAMGLALSLVVGGAAQHADDDNYFVRNPGPVAGQTGVDRYDPYAPVDLGGASSTSLRMGVDLGDQATSPGEAEDPCSPQRCKAW